MLGGERWALRVSIAVIATSWAVALLSQLAGLDDHAVPGSVAQIARFVLINGAIQCAVIALLLRWGGEGPGAIGLRRAGLAGQLARGAGFGVLIFVLGNFVVGATLDALLPGGPDDAHRLADLFADWSELPLWLFCGVVGGGIIEEGSRAFALTRWRRFGGRRGLVFALVVDTVVFGIGHLYQGVPGAMAAGFAGLCNAFVFLRRGSAVEAMTAHAVFDVIGIIGAYMQFAPAA